MNCLKTEVKLLSPPMGILFLKYFSRLSGSACLKVPLCANPTKPVDGRRMLSCRSGHGNWLPGAVNLLYDVLLQLKPVPARKT